MTGRISNRCLAPRNWDFVLATDHTQLHRGPAVTLNACLTGRVRVVLGLGDCRTLRLTSEGQSNALRLTGSEKLPFSPFFFTWNFYSVKFLTV